MDVPAATEVSCSHDEEFYSDRGPEKVNPPDPNAALMYKYFVANDGSHDKGSTAPEPISSRTRRKLLQAGKDGRQVVTSADVCNAMGSSSEEEIEQATATARKSERLFRDSRLSGVGGDRVGRATLRHTLRRC